MILVQLEPVLPVVVEEGKAEVLMNLAVNHRQRIYSDRADLVAFLNELQDGLAAIHAPRGLTRVLLFYRDDWAVEEVAKRMAKDGDIQAWKQPMAWTDLAARLPELRAWARRFNPHWQTSPNMAGV